jgi:hypothetical protein
MVLRQLRLAGNEPCRYQFGPVVDNHLANPSGGAAGCSAGVFFDRMPKRKRTTLKGLTSISYKTIISIKEKTAIIKYFYSKTDDPQDQANPADLLDAHRETLVRRYDITDCEENRKA